MRPGNGSVRPHVTLGLLIVLAASTIHNFAGLGAGLIFAVAMGEFRTGRFPSGGFATAFYAAAGYAASRSILPSPVSTAVQIEEVARFATFGMIAPALLRVRVDELAKATTIFITITGC